MVLGVDKLANSVNVNVKKHIIVLLFLHISVLGISQQQDIVKRVYKNGIDKPNILTTHHFGILSARINQNFKKETTQNTTLSFTYESGNNFHPFVKAYLPKDQETRKQLKSKKWYHRGFDTTAIPNDSMNIFVDAVIKGFRLDFNYKIAPNHELGIAIRSYLITKGNYPFSIFTNDKFIEWFHSNIAGGEDSFSRKYLELNQAQIKYTDRKGRALNFNAGDFFVAGLEFNHFYHPNLFNNKTKRIHVNFGSHLGVNSSKFNPSIDLGISGNIIKKWEIGKNDLFSVASGVAALRKNIVNFGSVVQLGSSSLLFSKETMLEYTRYTQKGNYHAIGVNYQLQTPYNKRKESNYTYLVGDWENVGWWQNGFEKLYQNLSEWTLVYTYARQAWKVSLYLKQDLLVNNAPDIQTGIKIEIPIHLKGK